ncbi:MAG: IPT/TIG domain-containing protein [Solirubrobacterales bacterium]
MSSVRNSNFKLFHAVPVAAAALLSVALLLMLGSSDVNAKKATTSASKLPSITRIDPHKAKIGTTLTISGKNFVKGRKGVLVIFQRSGSKRKFSVVGKGLSTRTATVTVPDVSTDLVQSNGSYPDDQNQYAARIVTKYGASKKFTSKTISPVFILNPNVPAGDPAAPQADCDKDGIINSLDTDDDNDMLPDTTEQAIGTDLCNSDTDGDIASDFYEYTVLSQYNGSPPLNFPNLTSPSNPLVGDSGRDLDGDLLSAVEEYKAWRLTGLMSHFYSDAKQDSDNDGILDGAEDEDGDKIPNLIERDGFNDPSGSGALDWLVNDTDGDGLCDGLDDQDHDGPPPTLAEADCTTAVPNNGPGGTPPSTSGAGDPDGAKIDADDNIYSNYYEWMHEGFQYAPASEAYDPCTPSGYPTSPFCAELPTFP